MTINEDNFELFRQYQTVEPQKKVLLRNKLIMRNQALVPYIVNKYYSKAIDHSNRDDIMQEGTMGLMNAIEAYDVTLGHQFSTYATWWIRQAVNQYLGNEQIIHIPNHIRVAQNKILKEVSEKGGDNSNILEKAYEKLNKGDSDFTPKMINSIKSAFESKNVSSIDALVTSDSTSCDQAQPIDNQKLTISVAKALDTLTEREKNILLLRFNLINEREVVKSGRKQQASREKLSAKTKKGH